MCIYIYTIHICACNNNERRVKGLEGEWEVCGEWFGRKKGKGEIL